MHLTEKATYKLGWFPSFVFTQQHQPTNKDSLVSGFLGFKDRKQVLVLKGSWQGCNLNKKTRRMGCTPYHYCRNDAIRFIQKTNKSKHNGIKAGEGKVTHFTRQSCFVKTMQSAPYTFIYQISHDYACVINLVIEPTHSDLCSHLRKHTN